MPWIIRSHNQWVIDRLVRLAGGKIQLVEKASSELKSELKRVPKLEEVVLRIVSENRIIANESTNH